MLHANEPGTSPGPVFCLAANPETHSAEALRLQTLTRRGLAPRLAEILGPFVWGVRADG
jgi:hypothetical protein